MAEWGKSKMSQLVEKEEEPVKLRNETEALFYCQDPGCPFQRKTDFGSTFCKEGWTGLESGARQQSLLDQPKVKGVDSQASERKVSHYRTVS